MLSVGARLDMTESRVSHDAALKCSLEQPGLKDEIVTSSREAIKTNRILIPGNIVSCSILDIRA